MQSRLRRRRHSLLLILPFSLLTITSLAAEHPLKLLPVSYHNDQSDQLNFLDTASVFQTLQTDQAEPEIIAFQPVRQTLIKEFDLDSLVSFSFRPEPNRNLTDYTPVLQCHFPEVLNISDVHLAPPVLMSDGRANYTGTVSFERAVGRASLTILFQRLDKTVYTSVSFDYIICGISFYYIDGDRKVLLADNTLSISSYKAVAKRQVQLFYCVIQFPDGSTSQKVISDFASLPSLSTIATDVKGDSIIPTHSFPTCKHEPYLKNETVALPESCPFGFTSFSKSSEPYFAVRLLRYRTGTITFHFIWADFLANFKSGEIFETSLTISVVGKSQTSIVAVAPSSPFRKEGGQLLRYTLINAGPLEKYALRLGQHRLQPLSIAASSGLVTATFVTPKGSGQNIPWDLTFEKQGRHISCPWASEEDRFVFSYAEKDVVIHSLSPSFGPVTGGMTITCSGYFADFSLTRGDRFMIGTYRLEEKHIVSISHTSLVFKLPPKPVVDTHAFEVFCYFVIRGIHSNEVKFSYESLSTARVSVAGASYQATNNTHMIPFCAKSSSNIANASLDLFTHLNSGAILQFLEFHWHLVIPSSKQEVFKLSGGVEAQSLALPLRQLSVAHVYKAVVVIRDKRFQTEVSSSVLLQPTYSRMLGIGISVDPTRTLVFPPVDPRMVATVSDLGKCFGVNKRLSYEWTFLLKKTSLSYESEDVNGDIPSPRRFGREYIVPRKFLRYGLHEVQLKVFYTDNPDAFGTAIGHLNVEPAPLKAVIGSGQSLIRVSSSSVLNLTGGNSYDRDSPSVTGQGLVYLWRCELSVTGGIGFASSVACPSDLVPEGYSAKKSFAIPPSNLRAVKTLNGSTFLRFFLQVKKINTQKSETRVSSSVSQVVEVVASETSIAELGRITLSGPDDTPIDADNVPYFDTVVLSPQASEDFTWRFKLVEPAEEDVKFLQNPNNLLHVPGFYKSKNLIATRNVLGIRRGALKASTKYTFQVEYESRLSKEPNVVQMTFKTMPSPQLQFLSLSQTEGTTETVFFAKAMSSVADYSFKYYFFIKLDDGSEVCIDGCSGHRTVSFRVPMEGVHVVRCVLVDARGKYVLAQAEKTQKVTIRSEGLAKHGVITETSMLLDSLQLGDHSTFSLASISLASHARTVDLKRREESEKVGNLVMATLDQLSDLYRKSQTNTQLAKDYLKITRAFASLPTGHEGLATEKSFYRLCQMMYYAVSNMPNRERFDMATDLNATIAYMMGHARQLSSSGSSRDRLIQGLDHGPGEVNEKLLELSEMTVPLWATLRSRDTVCGDTRTDDVGGVARVSTGTYCTKEHGLVMTGEFSRLEWCKGVFGNSGIQRTSIVLGEYRRDYISESRVLRLRRHVAKLPTVNNGSVSVSTDDMASHGYGIVRTMLHFVDGGVHLSKGCLQLTQQVRPTRDLFKKFGGGVICNSARGIVYLNEKKLNEELKPEAYSERPLPSKDVNASSTLARQATVEVTSEIEANGRYGVKRVQCKHVNAATFGIVNGIWIPIVVTIGVCVLTLVVMVGGVKIGESRAMNATVESGSAAYIERDIYGRDAHYMDDASMDADEDGQMKGETAEGEEIVFERKSSGDGG